MKVIKRLAVLIAIGALAGVLESCSGNTQQTQALCMATLVGACVQQYDPITNRSGNGQCVKDAAMTCGIVPAPVASPNPTATH